MASLLERASYWAARVTNIVVVLAAAVMMTALILQVFSRYLFNTSLTWSEELALILFTWTTLLAATSALRDGAHVRLDLVLSLLPEGARGIAQRVIMLLILAFCLILAWSGWTYTTSTMGQVSAAMRLPIEVLHLAAPVCGLLGALHALARLFRPAEADAGELIG